MDLMPPSGSKILVTTSGADPVITIPQGSGGPMRYFVGLFLLFWLGGRFAGFSSSAAKLWSGGWNLKRRMASSHSGLEAGRWVAHVQCSFSTGYFVLLPRNS